MAMGKTVYVPRADAPGVRCTLRDVCDELAVVPEQLMSWIIRGQLPSPDVVRGRFAFSMSYALAVRCNGVRFEGTYEPPPVTYRQRKAMIAEANRNGEPYRGGRPKGRKDSKPRANYRKGGAR